MTQRSTRGNSATDVIVQLRSVSGSEGEMDGVGMVFERVAGVRVWVGFLDPQG